MGSGCRTRTNRTDYPFPEWAQETQGGFGLDPPFVGSDQPPLRATTLSYGILGKFAGDIANISCV